MSKLEVDAIEPQSGTTLTLGASGDTITVPTGATLSNSGIITNFVSTGIDDNATANALTLDSSGNLQFNSGYGSVATAYGCRAWINFNGTGTPAIRESGNVTSITDNGTGNYTVNLTTALPDSNYAVSGCTGGNGSDPIMYTGGFLCPQQTTSTFVIRTGSTNADTDVDRAFIFATVHR